MNKAGIISIVLVVLGLGYFIYRKRRNTALGKIPSKPPKVRIVYSKKQKVSERTQVDSPLTIVRILRQVWSKQIEVREEFVVLFLDKMHNVLGYQILSKGNIDATLADARLIYAAALNTLATAIVVAHNHPSGNLTPSAADIQLTRKIQQAGRVLDITLLDHIILTKNDFYSFADDGLV